MLYVPRRLRDAGFKVLRGVRPNAGVAAKYRKALTALIKQMHDETMAIIAPTYQENPPEMAADATPANQLSNAMRQLSSRWLSNFDNLASRLGDYFATDVSDRSDIQLRRILKQSGFTVDFSMTPAMRDVIESVVHENVSLIKSIPQQYLNNVEGSVMRSVQAGRKLSTLTEELQSHYGVSRRRAELISRDQNNKATAALNRVRQTELGIEEAIWRHSHAGKVPRATHVKMDGKKYSVKEGMYDSAEGRRIQPGELINCRCFSQPIIQGL